MSFAMSFLSGFGVNVGIAAWSLLLGLLIGVPLAWLRTRKGRLGRVASLLVSPMRSAPTFVVMFFLLNALPPRLGLGSMELTVTPWMSVMLSLAVYACSYVADNAVPALKHLQAGEAGAALLFLPALARAFAVIVLSSSAGAAVGVVEATTVTLREIERAADGADKLIIMLGVTLFFIVTFQSLYAAIDVIRHRITVSIASTATSNR